MHLHANFVLEMQIGYDKNLTDEKYSSCNLVAHR